jgi:hypothetical protein
MLARAPRWSGLVLPALAVLGCGSDLFHGTGWPTACDLDPATPGCPRQETEAGAPADQSAPGDGGVEAPEEGSGAEPDAKDVTDSGSLGEGQDAPGDRDGAPDGG